MSLRLLARAAPVVLGAVALAIWLRRRQAQRLGGPQRRVGLQRSPSAPPAEPRPLEVPPAEPRPLEVPPAEPRPLEVPPAEPRPLEAPPTRPPPRTGRFDRPPAPAPPERQSKRFVRASERGPIDIVTVVDDLLGPTR